MVLSLIFTKNDVDLLHEWSYLKNDINRLCLDLKKLMMEHNKIYLDYTKNQEKSSIEQTLNK